VLPAAAATGAQGACSAAQLAVLPLLMVLAQRASILFLDEYEIGSCLAWRTVMGWGTLWQLAVL
jgi:hypothetical protein